MFLIALQYNGFIIYAEHILILGVYYTPIYVPENLYI